MAPFFLGFGMTISISVLAPLTKAALHPACDFGPRLFAALAGWGCVALPGPGGLWWAYLAGPLVGGPLGATLYDLLVRAVPAREEQPVLYYDETATRT